MICKIEASLDSSSECRIVDKGVDLDLLARIYRNPPHFDTRKSRQILGLTYTDIALTANDMAESVINHGLVYD